MHENQRISLIIASGNLGKVREFKELLRKLPLNVKAQPEALEIEETGKSFIENARIKAVTVSKFSNDWVLADDSGLSVEALNGAPGIHSSRYEATDFERIHKLLKNLQSYDNRKANFTAALCLAFKGNVLIEVEGKCEGIITREPRGEEGFGYDPIFEVINLGLTFAEMGVNKKKQYGHRGIAFKLLMPQLMSLIEDRKILNESPSAHEDRM
tara:strand:+ start:586 stop:1221 length:636 start_codon:yes stop_codon:yes gene_type:complete